MITADWAEQAKTDVQELLSHSGTTATDRLDLLVAYGRWVIALDPEGGRIDSEVQRAARGYLGRPIDAADALPDLRGTAEALLNVSSLDSLPRFSTDEARCYVEERIECGIGLAALENLWPYEAEELHRYVRKRRGLGRHDLALESVQPWRECAEALALPKAIAGFSGLRSLLFGPLSPAVELQSPLHLAIAERRVSVATWHDVAYRILEPCVNGAGRETAVDAALVHLLFIAALDPDLARTMLQGRWQGLLSQQAADTRRMPLQLFDAPAADVVAGGKLLQQLLRDPKPHTLGTRALSVAAAAYAQLIMAHAVTVVLLRAHLLRLRGLVPARPASGMGAATLEMILGESWEILRENDLEVVIAMDATDRLVATVEEKGRPIPGVIVLLEHILSSGTSIERARGETDMHGRVILGPVANFPMPQGDERYQVTVMRLAKQNIRTE